MYIYIINKNINQKYIILFLLMYIIRYQQLNTKKNQKELLYF